MPVNANKEPENQRAESVPSELEAFAQKLMSEQQPLGKDFARVLEENLWELYVRS